MLQMFLAEIYYKPFSNCNLIAQGMYFDAIIAVVKNNILPY